MIRNLKALGLILLAILALGAMVTSGASASVSIFHSAATTSNTISTGTSENNQVFTRGALSVSCSQAHLEGTDPTSSQSTTRYAISYKIPCIGPLNSQVHVDFTTGKCGYHFTGTASKTAQAKLTCNEPGGSVTMTATNSDGSSLCTIHIPPQTVGGHVVFSDVKHNNISSLTAETTVTNISSTRTGSALCGAENSNNATYTGNLTITGYEDNAEGKEGKQVAIEVT